MNIDRESAAAPENSSRRVTVSAALLGRAARRATGDGTRRTVTTLLLSLLVSIVMFAGLGTSTAGAITPAQTTSVGSIRALYPDLNNFWSANFRGWGWSRYYRSPTVHFYNQPVYECGFRMPINNSWACGGAYIGNIWIDTTWTQRLQNRNGDYATGVILAHEWGHEIMDDLGWTSRSGTIGRELFADCLAGMYTRYGITVSHRLYSQDYGEGYNTLVQIAGGDHGTPTQRTEWYRYGYTSYNINSCYRALT